jgi:hypothetical protein
MIKKTEVHFLFLLKILATTSAGTTSHTGAGMTPRYDLPQKCSRDKCGRVSVGQVIREPVKNSKSKSPTSWGFCIFSCNAL